MIKVVKMMSLIHEGLEKKKDNLECSGQYSTVHVLSPPVQIYDSCDIRVCMLSKCSMLYIHYSYIPIH
jgi:hypothetical protein